MLDLIINSQGVTAKALAEKLIANGHEVDAMNLPIDANQEQQIKTVLEAKAEAGSYYSNIFINLTDGLSELQDFNQDPATAINEVEKRLQEILKTLKYGSQHLTRSDGGRIWVLLYDHSVNMSVDAPCNPIINNAVIAAVQSIAKEVARFDVTVNTFFIHPPKESLPASMWRQAKQSLKVYNMKYKPQSVEHISEMLHLYSEAKHFGTTGGVIPIGTGIAICNI